MRCRHRCCGISTPFASCDSQHQQRSHHLMRAKRSYNQCLSSIQEVLVANITHAVCNGRSLDHRDNIHRIGRQISIPISQTPRPSGFRSILCKVLHHHGHRRHSYHRLCERNPPLLFSTFGTSFTYIGLLLSGSFRLHSKTSLWIGSRS